MSTTATSWYPDNLLLPNSSQTPLQHPGGYYGNNHAPRGPVTHNLSLMQSEPALHVPQHFDTPPHHLGGVSHHPYTPSGSYSNIAMNSPLGPPSQPPTHFSNYLDPLYRHERSKSLGNLRLLSQTQRSALTYTNMDYYLYFMVWRYALCTCIDDTFVLFYGCMYVRVQHVCTLLVLRAYYRIYLQRLYMYMYVSFLTNQYLHTAFLGCPNIYDWVN